MSIAPQKFLVDSIAEERVSVTIIVPPEADSHSYEPTPRQIISVQEGDIWFRLGEGFENRLLKTLKKEMLIVDQREGIALIGSSCCHRDSYDPHIWLSPLLLINQAQQIANTLSVYDPENASLYQKNLEFLVCQLYALDQEIRQVTLVAKNRDILVSHSAFGYFCKEYGFRQISIEMEGKEPTAKYLSTLLANSRTLNIKTVILMKQYGQRGGIKIAKEIDAQTIQVDPYAENVIENLRFIAKVFSL